MSGWIKLHRNILDWEWYSHPPTRVLFMHLLLVANREPSTFQGEAIPAGGKAVGRKQLSAETGLTEQQIRTALINLESTNEITIKTTNRFSVVTLVNWATYQDGKIKQPSKQPAIPQPINSQSTTEEEVINNKPVVVYAHVELGKEISKITGWEDNPNWTGNYSLAEIWLQKGFCPERDIIPTIKQIMGKRTDPPSNLKYFDKAIAQAYADRNREIKIPEARHESTSNIHGKSKGDDWVQEAKARALRDLGVEVPSS